MSGLSTHVLDTSTGRPARELAVCLEVRDGERWRELARRDTDGDGRVRDLIAAGELVAGIYRLTFATASYFARDGRACFYPEVAIAFAVSAPGEHHHVPLLVSPFGYSTYRGS